MGLGDLMEGRLPKRASGRALRGTTRTMGTDDQCAGFDPDV